MEDNFVRVKCSMRGRDEKYIEKTKGNRPLGETA